MLSPAELQQRKRGIFSTDAAGCLGLSKYSSPVSIWMEKTGAANEDVDEEPNEDAIEQTEQQAMGLIMQPVIARLYEGRTGMVLKDLEGVTMFSDAVPFMGSHFDYQVKGQRRLVEAKNFHDRRAREFGDPGSDDVPMDCLVQCLHEGFVFGADSVDLAVLFGGQKFEIYTIQVGGSAIEMLINKLTEFWSLVQRNEPPPPQTNADVRALFKRDNGTEVVASHGVEQACNDLKQIKERIKEAETMADQLAVIVKRSIGDNAVLRAQAGHILATWKNSKDGKVFNKKAFEAQNPSLYESFLHEKTGNRPLLLK